MVAGMLTQVYVISNTIFGENGRVELRQITLPYIGLTTFGLTEAEDCWTV